MVGVLVVVFSGDGIDCFSKGVIVINIELKCIIGLVLEMIGLGVS